MCSCDKPNVNGEHGYKWQPSDNPAKHVVLPCVHKEGDIVLSNDPGRCGHGIDSHAFHFCIVRRGAWHFIIATHFNGSTEVNMKRWSNVNSILAMSSDDRYWTLQAIYHAVTDSVRDATHKAVQEERQFWRQAAADNRIKKRKVRNTNRVDVWVLNQDSNLPLSRSL